MWPGGGAVSGRIDRVSERPEPIETFEVDLSHDVAYTWDEESAGEPGVEPAELQARPAEFDGDPAERDEEPAGPEGKSAESDGEPAESDGEPAESDGEPAGPGYQRFDCTTGDAAMLTEATEAARKAIERGECVVLPTDTVYGIGADAFNHEAIQRLLDAKVRGRDMPAAVLIGMPTLIRALAVDVPLAAKDLVAQHWPGALTVICKIQPSLKMDLGESQGTIALRVPDHELAQEILRRTGPMAVSSANISGLPAAMTCDEAIDQLGDSVAVYLDAGRIGATDAAPSTIVDFTKSDVGEVLRHGALDVALLRQICPDLIDLVDPDGPPDPVVEFDAELDDSPDAVVEFDAEPDDSPDADADAEPGAEPDVRTDRPPETPPDRSGG
jgi:L-threonylcarbamoyladenylate synthase